MAITRKKSDEMKSVLLRGGRIGIFLSPFILWMLPSTYFDSGQTVCLSRYIFDAPCPGCGMTRAVQLIMHFDFEVAWAFNKLVVLIFHFLIFIWCKETVTLYRFIAMYSLKA
jgi:hypothetical protein